MTTDGKRMSLIYLGLASIAIFLIAAALPRLEFHPGIPLPGWENRSDAPQMESMVLPPISVNTFVRAILGILLLSALAYSGYKVIRGASWKEILSSSRFIAALVLLFLVVIGILFVVVNLSITDLPSAPEILPPTLAIQGEQLGPLPPGLIWLVWIGLGLVITLLVFRIIRWQIQRGRSSDPLILEAERALQALKSGEIFKNVIVRCYREMSLVLKREQGIELEETMTAQEFERLLLARGIPHTPIDQLTRLFEAARYGSRSPTPVNEQEAYDCLNAIVLHIRKEKKPH
jgi:hypothetical protein